MIKPSPFEQVHLQFGARMKNYHGWRLPSRFDTMETEQKALENHCAAFDLCSFGRVGVKGAGAAKVLEMMGFSDVPRQASQQWNWVKNGSQSCRIAALQNEYIVFSAPGHGVLEKLRKISSQNHSDVQITDLSEKTAFLGLYGPRSLDSVSGLLPFEMDELTPGSVMPVSFFMMNLLLLRGSWLGGEGLELMCPASAAGLIGGAIAKYRRKYNITPAGMDCLMAAMNKNFEANS